MRLLKARAPLVGEAQVQELDREQAEDEDAGVGGRERRRRGFVQAFGGGRTPFQPFARASRLAAQVLDHAVDETRGKDERLILAPSGESVAALGEGLRFVELAP